MKPSMLWTIGGAVGLYLLYEYLKTSCQPGDGGLCSAYNSWFGAAVSTTTSTTPVTTTPPVAYPGGLQPGSGSPSVTVTTPGPAQSQAHSDPTIPARTVADQLTADSGATMETFDGWNYYYQKRNGNYLQASAGTNTTTTLMDVNQFLNAAGLNATPTGGAH